MNLVSSYWPANVPETLWQFELLVPEQGRSLPFVGIAVTWQFICAFLAGCALICAFAWKRFSEPTYDVNSHAFRDFRELKVWNMQDSASLRRAYVIYCISLIFIFAIFAFFGRVIVQLVNQWNVSGLQINVGTVDFNSWRWPLLLALGIAGFAPLLNPLVPAENWLRRFSHEAVGIPTRIRDKAVRIRTLIDGAPTETDPKPTSNWVKTTLGPKLNACLVLERHLQTVVNWSYTEHVQWSDPEIRRKLNDYERLVRDEAETALDEFTFLTDPKKVPDKSFIASEGQRQQYEKRLGASVAALEAARDKFSIIMAIYCEHGSRLHGLTGDAHLQNEFSKLVEMREPPATGLPLYAFVAVIIAYFLAVKMQYHALISAIPSTDANILITAALETLKVFLLVWLPVTLVGTFTSVVAPDRGDRSVKESELWAVIPGAIAALAVAALGMAMFAFLYAALPASNLAQMQQSLLGANGALFYFLLFTPTALICFCFVAWMRMMDRPHSFWLSLTLAVAAGAMTLGYLVTITTSGGCNRILEVGGEPVPVTAWRVLAAVPHIGPWRLEPDDFETCFAYYSALDLIIIPVAVFLSTLGLSERRLPDLKRSRAPRNMPLALGRVTTLTILLLASTGGDAHAKEVWLGFRTDIQPFSFASPDLSDPGPSTDDDRRPYNGYIADLCYEIFANSQYEIRQASVTAANRFQLVRRPGEQQIPGKIDVLCDATTVRLDDPERIDAGIFSPVIFVSGVSYLWRSTRSFAHVELGFVANSTAKRVAEEACKVDALRLGQDRNAKPKCRERQLSDCRHSLISQPAEVGALPMTKRSETRLLREVTKKVPDYVLCPMEDHNELITWFCADTDRDKAYFGDRDIILGKLAEWQAQGRDCADVRDPRQSFSYEPYALLISLADPDLVRFVQRRVYEIFSHRSGAEALFYKWFPGQNLSEPLAWLFLLNGVMDQDTMLYGPKDRPAALGH